MSEIRVVAQIDLGRTRRAAPRHPHAGHLFILRRFLAELFLRHKIFVVDLAIRARAKLVVIKMTIAHTTVFYATYFYAEK